MPGGLIVARTFDREFRFHLPDRASRDALAVHAAMPEAPQPAARVEITVTALGGGWYDFAPPFSGQPASAEQLAERVRLALGEAMAEEAGGDPLLNAGLVRAGGRRLVLVTPDHAARHRLALACLCGGLEVETSTMVLLRRGEALAWPAPIRAPRDWAGTEPALARLFAASPWATDWNGVAIHAVAPDPEGGRWRLTGGPADASVFLEADAGRFAHAGAIPPEDAFGRLLDALAASGSRGTAFGALHALSRAASGWTLRFGDPERAVWHIRRIAENGTTQL